MKEKTKLFCKWFGHKPWSQAPYRNAGAEYLHDAGASTVDGIGRPHVWLKAECSRCGQTFQIGKVHLWNESLLKSVGR